MDRRKKQDLLKFSTSLDPRPFRGARAMSLEFEVEVKSKKFGRPEKLEILCDFYLTKKEPETKVEFLNELRSFLSSVVRGVEARLEDKSDEEARKFLEDQANEEEKEEEEKEEEKDPYREAFEAGASEVDIDPWN